MIRIVLDSNVILSALHFGGKPAKVLKLAIEGKGQFFISREIVTETLGILRKKFAYEKVTIEELEELLFETFILVEPQQTVRIIKGKPADNRILECGLAAKADFIISGDKKHLLPLKNHQGIKIVSCQEFLAQHGSA